MKFNYLIKATPFVSTLLLVIFLTFSNQREYTKLRVLIWDTPSLTLGSYLALSAGTGFIFSYLVTINLAKTSISKGPNKLKFKEKKNYPENINFNETHTNSSYENILIERDIKDPSPTINANFRIIGNTENSNFNYGAKNNIHDPGSIEFEEQYNEQLDKTETFNQVMTDSKDWNDESYSQW